MPKHHEIKTNWSVPVWLENGDKVTVFEGVTLDTTKGSLIGISAGQGSNEVIVHGHVIAENFGLGLRVPDPSGTGHDKVWVSSTGSIKGYYAIELTDASTVTIDGTVTGQANGIISKDALTLTNSGTIKAEGIPGFSVAISSDGKLNLTNNSGATIKGTKYGIWASDEADVIRNVGHIEVSDNSGIDAVYLGEGNDRYDGRGGTVKGSVDLAEGNDGGIGGAGIETFFGAEGDDSIEGGGGNDTIDGGSDKDTATFSGKRSDYSVVKKNDGSFVVSDKRSAGDGVDTVISVEAFKFSDRTVQAADLLSTNPIETGNPGNPGNHGAPGEGLTLVGTKKKDVLTGAASNDKIYGMSGNDMLTGDAGQDTFVFNTALGKGTKASNHNKKVNYDTITDFNAVDDTIWLDNKIFKKLGKLGSEASPAKLNDKFFKLGKATDKDDYLIYKNGVLFYDADGNGTEHKAVEIIKIANKAAITASDFLIV